MVFAPLAAAALLVAACTGSSQHAAGVARSSAADPLVIRAALAGSTRTATVSVPGGPGPSIIDLPAPGCWTLHLSWSGHTDELQLRYVA